MAILQLELESRGLEPALKLGLSEIATLKLEPGKQRLGLPFQVQNRRSSFRLSNSCLRNWGLASGSSLKLVGRESLDPVEQ